MSTPSRMTIAWDRLDQMALLPQDSSVVIPPPKTTIAWTPLLGPTIFDYDPNDFVVTPGAGEEVASRRRPPEAAAAPRRPAVSPTPPHYGRPHLTIAHRRSVKLFLKDGYFVDIHTTAPAHVRAVLQTKAKGKKGKTHTVNLSKVLNTKVGGGRAQTDPAPVAWRPDVPEQAERVDLGDAGSGRQLRQRPETRPAAPAREHRRVASPAVRALAASSPS